MIRTELDVYAPEVPDKMFHDINKIYKARRVAGRSGSSAAVQRNLDSLKKEADGNIINFHNGTCKILQVVGINPRHRCVQVQRVEGGYPSSALVRQVLGPVVVPHNKGESVVAFCPLYLELLQLRVPATTHAKNDFICCTYRNHNIETVQQKHNI